MRIPERLNKLLGSDPGLHGAVEVGLASFRPWLELNRLTFFPEYTDHGTKHVEEVLETAQGLIRQEAWSGILGPEDAAVLVLSVLLHDIAMHLTADGFVAMITGHYPETTITHFGDRQWPELWEDFVAEARRFDGRKLMGLFGNTDPISRPNLENLSDRDKLLIGEFVRRHHARLAHEIALIGVPGPQANRIKLEHIDRNLVDLAGLVARSHGLPLRRCLDYLREKYHGVSRCCRVYVPFLMSVLRIADYIQIQAERAPNQLLQVARLRSPVSVREWSVHHAIRDIRRAEHDPEAIFIDATPADVDTFLKIERLTRSIQTELDASWSTLGEAYGFNIPQLGLTLRRIHSNLEDVEVFAAKVDYVPREAHFRAAHGDLLGLLAAPLYGEKPEVGIRELLQNAVDAVLEAREFIKLYPDCEKCEFMKLTGDVVVHLRELGGRFWVEVHDRGIGMTVDTAIDYFLTAGASFRQSDAWKKDFQRDGRSQVHRSGRFGIGVIAAFLLGPTVIVSTRHIRETKGIQFTATMETESIEMKKTARPVGTSIWIDVDARTWHKLAKQTREWDWYCLNDPTVVRTINDKNIPQGHSFPPLANEPALPWRSLSSEYRSIHWAHHNPHILACNGLIIDRHYRTRGTSAWILSGVFIPPTLSICDPDGRLPLNLQRTELVTGKLPFEEDLLRDIMRDYIAFMLVKSPLAALSSENASQWESVRYPGIELSGILGPSWCHSTASPYGTIPTLPHTLARSGPSRFLAYFHVTKSTRSSLNLNCTREALRCLTQSSLEPDFIANRLASLRSTNGWMSTYNPISGLLQRGRRVILPAALADVWFHPAGQLAELVTDHSEEWRGGGWACWAQGDCPSDAFDFDELVHKCHTHNSKDVGPILVDCYLAEKHPHLEDDPISAVWREIVRSPHIPYDMAIRRHTLAHAFAELEKEIRIHEKS